MGGTDPLDNLVVKIYIARAKYVGVAQDGRLQNRIIVRITHNSWRRVRHLDQNTGRLQKHKVLFYVFACEDQHMGARCDSQQQIAGKPLR